MPHLQGKQDKTGEQKRKFEAADMLEGKSILVTGGSGSFGNTFLPMTLEK